jgi:hypothetical protein
MSAPTLSVCVPNFNHGHYLAEALRSVLDQSFQPAEILVLDDASTDDSWDLIERFACENSRMKPMRNPENLGVIGSLNRLLAEARGDYIHFLAADDFLLPGFYAKAMQLLATHPAAGLCASKTFLLQNGYRRMYHGSDMAWGFTPRYFEPTELIPASGNICGNTVVIRRDALVETGGFRPELRWYCDWFANCVVGLRYGACFQPETLAVFRSSDGQYSSGQTIWADKRAVIRVMLRLLKEPAFADVRVGFRRSGVLSVLGDVGIVRTILDTPDLLDEETRSLADRLLALRDGPGIPLPQSRIAQYCEHYLRPRLEGLVNRWKTSAARVVIYGAGEHTSNLFKWTDLGQTNIVGLVDSNPDLAGHVYWSLPVSTPAALRGLEPDVVVISSMATQEGMYDTAREHVDDHVEVVLLYDRLDPVQAAGDGVQPATLSDPT